MSAHPSGAGAAGAMGGTAEVDAPVRTRKAKADARAIPPTHFMTPGFGNAAVSSEMTLVSSK